MVSKKYIRKIIWTIKGYFIWLLNKNNKRDNNIYVFGEWFGEKCGDNCTFFANYIAENYKYLKIYWVSKKNTDLSSLNPKIEILDYNSTKMINILKKAGFIFVGQNYFDFSSTGYNYTSGAISVLLWHGTPWKKIGFDATKKNSVFVKIYHHFQSIFNGYTYYLSTSPRYDLVIASAYFSDNEHTIKSGMPRNIDFYDEYAVINNKLFVLNKINKIMGTTFNQNTTIITYMPTFRANAEKQQDLGILLKDKEFLNYLIEKDIVIVVKSHFAASKKFTTLNMGESRLCYLNRINSQKLLAATGLLITDYSGCFFDYLILNRPIIHFIYDYDIYKNDDRGLYYEKEEVTAGSEVFTINELKIAIKLNLNNPNLFAYRRFEIKEKYMTYESEENCKNIFNQIQAKSKNK